MNSSVIANRRWSNAEKQALKSAAALQASEDDRGIDTSDIPALSADQLARMVQLREVRRKVPVSVRLDPEVLAGLKSKGEGHLTRINDILTNLMEAERRARQPFTAATKSLAPAQSAPPPPKTRRPVR